MSGEPQKADQRKLREDPQTSHWHLDKRVNVSMMVGIAVLVLSVVALFVRMEERTAQNSQAIADLKTLNHQFITYVAQQDALSARLTRTEGRTEESLNDIKVQLRRIEDKMDQKADK